MSSASYIMIGGFLGSGKTTALAALAGHFTHQGLRVGLITNDQGSELVDTAFLRSKGFPTEEIPGGCFCCRFDSLVTAVRKLGKAAAPEVYLAEPVGSCTDLVATVSYPLRRLHGSNYTLAPLSVLVDPVRAERVFRLDGGGNFSEKVLYIYRKQLEEADLIVITKIDLISRERYQRLRDKLAAEFPHAEILGVSIVEGTGVAEWFSRLETGTAGTRDAMAVDYEIYAEGEALLGWLNATIPISKPDGFNPETILQAAAYSIRSSLAPSEIAHLKIALQPKDGGPEIAMINLVDSHAGPFISQRLGSREKAARLILNLRAEAAPDDLQKAVRTAVADLMQEFHGLQAEVDHLEYFRPGKPVPTHRFTSLVS